ncbi:MULTISPECIES: chorismate mutase [Methanobacterium]|nr:MULTISPECIES: chorismate mutase [Methanobacterium]MCZ3371647.1 chorismate mutase [Methanobacterium veterum]
MKECKNMEEIRENIDIIDMEIVKLLSRRSYFVKEAAKFKKNAGEVEAPKRVEEVIQKVRSLAMKYGVQQDIVENIYRTMIQNFIDYEMDHHSKQTLK